MYKILFSQGEAGLFCSVFCAICKDATLDSWIYIIKAAAVHWVKVAPSQEHGILIGLMGLSLTFSESTTLLKCFQPGPIQVKKKFGRTKLTKFSCNFYRMF